MRFGAPWLLLLLPPALAATVYAWRRSYVGKVGRPMLVLRLVLASLIILALARPEVTLPARRTQVVALVDDSASLLPAWRTAARAALKEVGQALGEELEIYRFGEGVESATMDQPFGKRPQDESDLERALYRAAAHRPAGSAGRVLLLSDGNETRGDGRQAARLLGQEGVAIYPLRIAVPEPDPEVAVVGIDVPPGLHRGEHTDLVAHLRALRPASASLSLEEGERQVWSGTVKLAAGETPVRIPLTVGSAGLVHYRVQLTADADTHEENNHFERTVSVDGPPRVLVGTPALGETSALADALALQGLDVVRFDPEGPPQSLEELSGFDLLVLSNLPPARFNDETQAMFASYVSELGGGLLEVVGAAGLGTPDPRSALARVLPLASEEKIENQIPPVAMMLLIDRSGSMEGSKLSWTKRAALGAVEALPPDAQVGIIAFDAEYQWLAPLQRAGEREALSKQINALSAGGGTRFFPALEEAHYALGGSKASVKHVVLLTDGLSTDGVDFRPLARRMRAAGISVTTVAMSRQADRELLGMIAQESGGRFHLTDRAEEVPRIFIDESRLVAKQAHTERMVRPKVEGVAEGLAGINLGDAPPLHGYVATSLKAGADLLLSVESQRPLLARWRHGLGEVIAFASDTDGDWAREWVSWEGFPRLWAQLARQAMRVRRSAALPIVARLEGGVLRTEVTVTDPRRAIASDLEVELSAVDPALVSRRVALERIGPGRLRGSTPWSVSGPVVLRAQALSGGQAFAAGVTVLDRPYPKEYGIGEDTALLAEVARLSGGQVLEVSGVASVRSTRGKAPLPLAPLLLAAAVVIFLLDLGIKRVRPEGGAR